MAGEPQRRDFLSSVIDPLDRRVGRLESSIRELNEAAAPDPDNPTLDEHVAETTSAHGGIVADDDPRLTDARTPIAHGHDIDDIAGLAVELAGVTSTLAAKADLAGGKVPLSQLPALALTDVATVVDQAAQLALTAEEGDVAVRSDLNESFIHNGGTSGTMADWTKLATPTDAVLSVNGEVGAVVLSMSDIDGAGASEYRVPIFDGTDWTPGLLTGLSFDPASFAGEVAADESGVLYIKAEAITAGLLSADAIDGKLITGATFRTSDPAVDLKRIEISGSTDTIKGYDDAGVLAWQLDDGGLAFLDEFPRLSMGEAGELWYGVQPYVDDVVGPRVQLYSRGYSYLSPDHDGWPIVELAAVNSMDATNADALVYAAHRPGPQTNSHIGLAGIAARAGYDEPESYVIVENRYGGGNTAYTGKVTAQAAGHAVGVGGALSPRSLVTIIDSNGNSSFARVPGAWVAVGSGGSAPGFGAGWSNEGGGFAPARFRLEHDLVRLDGVVQGGAVGSTIFTLPADCRPTSSAHILDAIANNAVARITVNTDGQVVFTAGNSTYVALTGLVLPVS